MSRKTLTLNSEQLFLTSHKSLSFSPPPLSSGSPLPSVPSDLPQSKIVPKTRFVVDGFRYASDFSVSYFLSHFHSDHYTGLTPNWCKGIVFCSEITASLAVEILKISPFFVVQLPLNESISIDGCEVTLINANHCPGAVQFLFKVMGNDGKFERYVHTGDFRYSPLMKLEPSLNEFVGCDGVFLDTTYCNPKFIFPSQEESIDYVVSVIDRIGLENRNIPKSVLFLVATYVIGKEKILTEISCRCRCRVYVDSRKMEVLRALGYDDDSVFTADGSATDVHVVGWNVLGETWPYFRPNFVNMKDIMVKRGYCKVVGFVPTGWTYEVKRNKFAVRTKDAFEIHLVPYSEHSNYDELREYVRFLKPRRVIPTVGSDVENVDSKHALKMQKYFVGLVDEMANKQEFLLGFHRKSREKSEARFDDPLDKAMKQEEEKESKHHEEEPGAKTDSLSILHPSASIDYLGSQDATLLSDKDKDDIVQELRDCLPVWVTRDQMLELINISGKNIVDAVSYFYEHETEFYEQSSAHVESFTSSRTNVASECPSDPSRASVEVNLQTAINFSQKRDQKLLNLKPSAGSSISPGKRKRKSENKSNKKGKINPKLDTSGIKQSTITSFFGKVTNVSKAGADGPALGKCKSEKSVSINDAVETYKEEIEKFIQIINGDESSKGYAASIIEKARGDVSLALDMYYNNSHDLDINEKRSNSSGKLVQDEGADFGCLSNRAEELLEEKEAGQESYEQKNAVTTSREKESTNSVLLPPEHYSPIEHACWKHGQPAPFIHLARTFDLVEGEKGKIKATSMLCNMFRSLLILSPEDVLPAVYLCTNKIAADHENMELNVGGSLVASAVEEACGTNRAKIKDMYNRLGDLGDVAQECRQTQPLLVPPLPLLIRDVFSILRKISVQTGSGSTARRKSLIVGLLRSCREKEIKFLVRILVRNLRIGAMMRTILPALAQAVVMNSLPKNDPEGTVGYLKEKLQSLSGHVIEAYNILPDLDVVVPSLMDKGIDFSSTTLTMLPGIPIRPMLAKITNDVAQALKLFQNKAFTCEYKYDGQRAQIHKLVDGSVRIFSRNGEETTSRFPDLVHIIQDWCKPSAKSFILDAEVVGIDRQNGCKLLSFQELSSRERGSKGSLVRVDSIKVDICVFVFDIMFANGEKLLRFPLRQRRKYMNDLFGGEKLGYFEYAKEITVEAENAHPDCEATLIKINTFLEDAFQSSCEGIIIKSLDVDAGYFPSKRADSWLKVKRDYLEGVGDTLDLVPIGAWHGNGRKAGWYSPFLMACYNPDTEEFESVCRVMSGFSDSFYTEMKEFFSGDKILPKKPPYYHTDETPDMWFSPELVWEIRGADLTLSPVHKAAIGLVHQSRGISIRFPRFVRLVSDRRPEDCSTSVDVADMFRSQTRKMDVNVPG